MWTFQDFSVTQILREINFRILEVPKIAILLFLEALNLEFDDFFRADICPKTKFRVFETAKLAFFELFELIELLKLISRKIREYC